MKRTLGKTIAGHFWTVVPGLAAALRPRDWASDGQPIETTIFDSMVGQITIRGKYHDVESADTLVVIVHGIVGNADAEYCKAAAQAAVEAGCSAVRISLRGADGDGDDIYHPALTDDLRALLSMKCLRGYRRVFLLGYSFGGNMVLRAAADHIDSRIEGVIAICPPLDFKAAAENLDSLPGRPYRQMLKKCAVECYAAVERRGRAHTTTERLKRVRSSAEWYQVTMVPRFGFRDSDDYYNATSMTGRWHRIRVPVLIVSSLHDPIVPYESVRRVLAQAPPHVQAECVDGGGHVYFPGNVDLGEDAKPGLERQCMAWVARHVRSQKMIALGA